MFCKKCSVEGHTMFSVECVFFKETIDYISSRLTSVPKRERVIDFRQKEPHVKKIRKQETYDIKDLSEEEIVQLIKDNLKVCSCGYNYIYPLCDNCTHSSRIEHPLWKEIQNYCKDRGIISCNFCGKRNENGHRFHFDHLSIFDKSDNICSMVKNNNQLSDIILEIQKCQLLCIHCHCIVTKIENRYGFISMKIRSYHTDELKTCYKEKMDKVYEIFKKDF
jgi:hypothetical protein